MRSRPVILAIVAVLAAAAAIVGVAAVAGADSTTTLPSVSAADLLAQMGQSQGQTQSISGEVSWRNALFGNIADASGSFGMPAQNPLLASGSGRIWMSKDGVRVESQGGGGDQIAVLNTRNHDAWLYDYAASTARHITVTGAPQGSSTPTPSVSPMTITPSVASALLQQLAPLGTMTVAGQTTVAGRDAYVLKFTPAAADTAIGSVQAAVDGATYIPLRLQVFAKSGGEAVLQFGFDSVSFGAIDPSRFTFTPPAGTTVTTQTVDASKVRQHAMAQKSQLKAEAQKALAGAAVQQAFLTQAQAEGLVPFPLATASSTGTRSFRWAFVFKHGVPLSALGSPVLDMSGMSGAVGDAGAATQAGPAAVQVYGSGLGSIVLVQMPSSAQTESQLRQLPGVFGKMMVNGHRAAVVTTQLGGVAVWQQGDTTLVAAGLVPAADLTAFANSVR